MEYEEAEVNKKKEQHRRHINEKMDSLDDLNALIYFDNYITRLLEIMENEKQGN